jgi:hypothetical protein
MVMLLILNVVPCGSRPNRVIALTTRWSRTGSTPSGKVGSEMNAASSFWMPRYCSMAVSTAARLVSAISCPWDSAVVNAFRVLGYFLAHAAVTA